MGIKVSALPTLTVVGDTDIVYAIHSGTSYQTPAINLRPLVAVATGDMTAVTNTVLTNIPGMTVTLLASQKYAFQIYFSYIATSSLGNAVFDLAGGSANLTSINYRGERVATTGNVVAVSVETTTTTATVSGNSNTAPVGGIIVIHGNCVVNSGGTFIPRFAQKTSSTETATCNQSTNMVFYQV